MTFNRGKSVYRNFCPDCGSPITSTADAAGVHSNQIFKSATRGNAGDTQPIKFEPQTAKALGID